jgi:Asp-tRNA(Asn)/Glu-tRNA(Gln) amidotransferase A subunit family amidase
MSLGDSIVDATIAGLSTALAGGKLTSVELVAKYLLRISAYDCRNTVLNSIPLINERVFEEAAAADDRRAAGHARGSLEGIPFTVKDSYKVRGMTVASGSKAFENLIANEDAFTVKALREAGAVLLGRTNMCPMAYGGMLRGVYGRAESPYNKDYLPAAFGSGSSNGSGVSVAASFAAFGMGEETVSSGRSPASNNALVAYTPSRGLVSIRGNWPLYPTCDVVVPHTRTMSDLFVLLDVLSTQDRETAGDFWRDQPFIQLPQSPWPDSSGLLTTTNAGHLQGKRVAIPQIYLKQQDGGPYVSGAIEPLWRQAQADLQAAGASVEIISELPVLHIYEQMLRKPNTGAASSSLPYLPDDWNATERGLLIAHAWEAFLQDNRDPHIQSLTQVDPTDIFPHLPRDDPQVKFTEPANAVHWAKLASYVADRAPSTRPGKSPIYDVPGLEDAVRALEQIRIRFFEEWMSAHHYDFVAFPAVGDVARANADVDDRSAQHAWTDGVKYSHGNRALRHLGIPSVTVPMGILADSQMPIGLTFLSRAYDDPSLLQAGYAYEQNSKRRVPPPLTPPLASDAISKCDEIFSEPRPELLITKCCASPAQNGDIRVSIEGAVSAAPGSRDNFNPTLEIYVDGQHVSASLSLVTTPTAPDSRPAVSNFVCECSTSSPPAQDGRNRVVGKVARDSTMVMILARNGEGGRPSGYVKLLR